MITAKLRRILYAGMVAVCTIIIGCSGILVYAEPSSAELETKTTGLKNELDALTQELNALSDEMDSISSQILDISAEMEATQQRLNEAQAKGEAQYEAMKLRIKYMYEAGNTSFIEILCTAENMADFLNKTDYIKVVSEYDRDMLLELQNTQEEIMREGEALEEQQAALQAMQSELTTSRQTLESKISSTSAELGQYQEQLARAQEAEALAAQLAAHDETAGQGAENPDSIPVSSDAVAPPSLSSDGRQSLGTFRITHYCSCFYCCGGWGNATASGTAATPGRTIAVDPSVIPLGTRVIINGNVYVAEDTGGAITGNKIDIFVADHTTAITSGVYYAEVYLAD